jgi:hypothetical protein
MFVEESMRNSLFTLALAGAFAGCSETSITKVLDTEAGKPPGSILGRVCDPSGRHWLPDAMAYAHLIDGSGKLYDTRQAYTDRDGYFLLDDMPADRNYTVYVQYGDSILETHTVSVGQNEDVEIEEPDCFDPLELDVAVITGDYDDFQDVLRHMGFANYELIDGLFASEMSGFLMDLDTMLQYDIIVFNGGHVEEGLIYEMPEDDDDDDGPGSIFDDTGSPDTEDESDDGTEDGLDTGAPDDGDDEPAPTVYEYEVIRSNIKAYVEAGGAIYASDWAYDVVEQTWPEAINFVGADEIPDAAQLGEYGIVNAAVSDAALAEWLDSDYTQVEFDLPVWPPIEGVADTVSVHLTGSIDYREGINIYTVAASPLLVSFTVGDGKVAYSTFRVAKNADADIILTLQYMMYSL